jgi:hypothetical protein
MKHGKQPRKRKEGLTGFEVDMRVVAAIRRESYYHLVQVVGSVVMKK